MFGGSAIAIALAIVPAAHAKVSPEQDAVRLIQPATARSAPSNSARAIARVETYTPMTLSGAVMPVVRRQVTGAGAKWVQIELSRRPNGATGWVPARVTRRVLIPWRLVVSTSRRTLTVYRQGRVFRRMKVVVGAKSTPTPRGHFYIVEHVKLHNSWAHGVWALATSAHSNVFQEFDGGDGQVALHGRGSLSAPLGTAASHGCVRLADSAVAWLARVIPNGTPLDVTR
jgi:lipoprotein-anchoring transpeptidase ErfK/SrfK